MAAPEEQKQQQQQSLGACRRCGGGAVVVVRNEPLCSDDLVSYIQTKIAKRLEAFRVRNAPAGSKRHLLLPLSLGVSSLTLLHVLDQQTKRQIARTGRTGYALHVLHILPREEDRHVAARALFEKFQARFPTHKYVTRTLDTPLPDLPGQATSATGQADFETIQRNRLVVKTAKEEGCEVVCWGDSTTRLAEKILAETAKGRGFALPWLVNDGETPFGVVYSFPVRDLLKKELASFSGILSPPLTDLLVDAGKKQTPVSSKNSTIDSLLTEYFASVEENFPGIVTNVVRTSGKLTAPPHDSKTVVCDSCMLPLQHDHMSLRAWAGQQNTADATEDGPEVDTDANLCYACSRALLD